MCLRGHIYIFKSIRIHLQWTKDEDELVCKYVELCKSAMSPPFSLLLFSFRSFLSALRADIFCVIADGTKQWARIALVLPGRKGKQCRERWHNHLNPDINKDAWTNDEDLKLVEAHLVREKETSERERIGLRERTCELRYGNGSQRNDAPCAEQGKPVGRNREGPARTHR